MPMQSPTQHLDADDRKTYAAWLRKMVAVYVVVLVGAAVVSVRTTFHGTNVALLTVDNLMPALP